MPCLIVQPLVENAIKHGVAPSVRGGDVQVLARLHTEGNQQTLVVSVLNTGAPLAAEPDTHTTRVGLNNVERRLAGHFGDRASLSLSAAHGVTTAEVRLPVSSTATSHGPTAARRAVG